MKLSDSWLKTACGLILITLLSITIFFDTWRSIVSIWYNSSTYNHGFVIAPISLWLCWSQRHAILTLSPTTSWIALLAVFANGFLWLIADLSTIQVIKQFAAVGMLVSGFWVILGNRIVSTILFPLCYLFFMVPVGGDLVAPLMDFTATFAVYLIRLSGIPVFREGLNLSLTTGNWTVAEACSGINYLIASTSLGLVYAYITYTRYWKRALFMALAVIVPVLANGFRAYFIVMLGHFSNMTLAVGIDHIIYGALFFGLIMMLLFYIGSFWKDPPVSQTIGLFRQDIAKPSFFLMLMLVAGSNLMWPMASAWLSKAQQMSESNVLEKAITFKDVGWQSVRDPGWGWLPHFNGVSKESMQYYANGQATVGVYRASFGQESQGGGELVNSQNILVTPEQRQTWKTIQTGTFQLTGNKPLPVDQTVLSGSERNLVILRWYQIGTDNTANPYRAKWLQLIKRLSRDSSPELQVVLVTEAPHGDAKQAQSALKMFMQSWALD